MFRPAAMFTPTSAPAAPAAPAAAPAASAAAYVPTTNEFARRAIRDLVEGGDPQQYAHLPAEAFGAWGEKVRLLCGAHAQKGSESVATVYASLLEIEDTFALFMSESDAGRRRAFKLRNLALDSFAPPEFLVPGLLPVGLSTLAGRPKIGKSWLVLQLLLAADCGGEFLGVPVPKTKALYLALEDSEYRLADRVKTLTAGQNIDYCTCGDADVVLDWPLFSQNGLSELRHALETGGYKLVIIDTLSRILGRSDQMDQQEMTRVMAALQRLAMDHHAAILLVDHHRKSARTSLDADPIDDILGSTAKGGVVDCALGLYRRHNEDTATLKLSGRDFGDQELNLTWDAPHCRWGLEPAKPAHPLYTLREQELIDTVAELRQASIKELVEQTGTNKGTLYTRLQNLVVRGALQARQSAAGMIYSLGASLSPDLQEVHPPPPGSPPPPPGSPPTTSRKSTHHLQEVHPFGANP